MNDAIRVSEQRIKSATTTLHYIQQLKEARLTYQDNPTDAVWDNVRRVMKHVAVAEWKETLENTSELSNINEQTRQHGIESCEQFLDDPTSAHYEQAKTTWRRILDSLSEDNFDAAQWKNMLESSEDFSNLETPLIQTAIAACEAYLQNPTSHNLKTVQMLRKRISLLAYDEDHIQDDLEAPIGQLTLSTYPEFPVKLFNSIAKKAKKRVKILQTWLSEEYLVELGMAEALMQAAQNGAEIELYFLDTLQKDSEGYHIAQQRRKDVGLPEDDPADVIRFTMQHLADMSHHYGVTEKFTVSLYSVLPHMAVYQCDNTIFAGHFPPKIRAIKSLHYQANLDESPIALLLNQQIIGGAFDALKQDTVTKHTLLSSLTA